MIKEHHFVLVVKTHGSRRSAEAAVLAAFGKRQPDGCGFFLKDNPDFESKHKEAWMNGAQAGSETVLDLVDRFVSKLRKKATKPS